MVTVLRVSGIAGTVRAAPHESQNCASGRFSRRHFEQIPTRQVYGPARGWGQVQKRKWPRQACADMGQLRSKGRTFESCRAHGSFKIARGLESHPAAGCLVASSDEASDALPPATISP